MFKEKNELSFIKIQSITKSKLGKNSIELWQ